MPILLIKNMAKPSDSQKSRDRTESKFGISLLDNTERRFPLQILYRQHSDQEFCTFTTETHATDLPKWSR